MCVLRQIEIVIEIFFRIVYAVTEKNLIGA